MKGAQLFTKFTAHDSAKAKKLGRKIKMRDDWKERKATPSIKESSGDGTGLFPQWEADGFDE